MIITFAGVNPNLDNSSIFFTGTTDYSDEYELDFTTNTISISRDEDQNYKMQRNSTKWLYGTKLAEESFYVKKKLLANLIDLDGIGRIQIDSINNISPPYCVQAKPVVTPTSQLCIQK